MRSDVTSYSCSAREAGLVVSPASLFTVPTTRTNARGELPGDLRGDIRRLGHALGDVLTSAGSKELLDDVERLRRAVIDAVERPDSSLDDAEAIVASFSPARAIEVGRAFTVYFHLVNLAEEAFRVRTLDERDDPELERDLEPGNSLARAYEAARDEVGEARAVELLRDVRFHPVFTAHPTEARRPEVTAPIRELVELVNERQVPDLSGRRRNQIDAEIARQVEILWMTAQLNPAKPAPLDEVRHALAVISSTVYPALTESLRRTQESLAAWDREVPDMAPYVRLGSWIGGDRDGNPHVTATTTRQAAAVSRTEALALLETEALEVARGLTGDDRHNPPSEELLRRWDELSLKDDEAAGEVEQVAPGQTHRKVILLVARRLAATAARHADLAYHSPDEAIEDIACVRESLLAIGAVHSANGPLRDLLWNVQTIGFHLVELEVRQHSKVHRQTLAWLDDPETVTAVDGAEVLDVFTAIAAIQRRSGGSAAGRYIVSFAQSAEDIVNVYKLAEAAPGPTPVLDVIPLFETFDDLMRAPEILAEAIQAEPLAARLEANGRHLEVMLGYSDSAKDVGPVAATIALYRAQEGIAAWALRENIHLSLFHGRGGALGRGGGPAHRAIMSQPPHSVAGRFKLTEQGEVIHARYGLKPIALRHIDQVGAATLLSSLPSWHEHLDKAKDDFADVAATLDEASRAAFLTLIHSDQFPQWFATVTPQEEVGWLNLGSRPAKRGLSVESLDDLRAIPWVFAWTQARINLTGWYGLGSALEAVGDLDVLRDAYQRWPLFETLIDNVEMSLAKADMRIAYKYFELSDRADLAQLVRDEFDATLTWVLKILDRDELLAGHRVLGRAVHMRNPYVDALSLLQLRALRAERAGEGDDYTRRLLNISVGGVAAGLQNTG